MKPAVQCEGRTRKRAWSNPHAPMAQCSRNAAVVMVHPDGKRRESVCRIHARRLESLGWTPEQGGTEG